jgi:hypothetical protein
VVFWWLHIIANIVLITASTAKLVVNRVMKQTAIESIAEAIILIIVTPIRHLVTILGLDVPNLTLS